MEIKVWHLRKKQNITLEQLSKLSGIPKSTLSDIESNRVEVKLYQLEKIANALNCHISDLYDSPYK